MPTDPRDYKGKVVAAQPYDQNRKPVAALFVPIVDDVTKEVKGYLPLKATDNGDGTATLKVDTEIEVSSNISIGNVKVGSSDAQSTGDRWLKVLSDGTLLVEVTNPALATAAKQDAVLAQLDVVLSSRASEATLGQALIRLGDIKAVLDALNTKDYATQATLSSVKVDLDTVLLRLPREGELLETGKLFSSIVARNSTGAPENIWLFVAGTAGATTLTIDVTINANNPLFELYLNPTVTANGTAQPAINLNRSSGNTPTSVLYDAPTITAVGTLLSGFMIGTERATRLTIPLKLVPGNRLLLRRVLTGAGNEMRMAVRWGE